MATLNIKGFPDDLYLDLAELAKIDHRSLSCEVIYLLEQALGKGVKNKGSILGLRGLGSKNWKGVDALKHIKNERETWE